MPCVHKRDVKGPWRGHRPSSLGICYKNMSECDLGYFILTGRNWLSYLKRRNPGNSLENFVTRATVIQVPSAGAMSSLNMARGFSRQGVNLLRFSQEQVVQTTTTASRIDGLIFRGAVLVSMFGVGFSMFSVSQLQDTHNTRTSQNKWAELIK
jgi:hypothetical protein